MDDGKSCEGVYNMFEHNIQQCYYLLNNWLLHRLLHYHLLLFTDIDECNGKDKKTLCPPRSKCINKPGKFVCECKAGYKQSESGTCEGSYSRMVYCRH